MSLDAIATCRRPRGRAIERRWLKQYAEAVALWNARFDTAEIAERLGLAEPVVARWVANFREMTRNT
jgi:hypothetical protein